MDDALCFRFVFMCVCDDFPTCFASKVNVSGVVVESENVCGLGVLTLRIKRLFCYKDFRVDGFRFSMIF